MAEAVRYYYSEVEGAVIAHGTSEELIRAIEEERDKLASLKCWNILKELGVKYRPVPAFSPTPTTSSSWRLS